MISRRRLAALGAGAVAAPHVVRAETPRRWRLVTSWARNLPGPGGVTAARLARRIAELSDGALVIDLFAAGEIVPALNVFDAVSAGTIEMGHTAACSGAARCRPRRSSRPSPSASDPPPCRMARCGRARAVGQALRTPRREAAAGRQHGSVQRGLVSQAGAVPGRRGRPAHPRRGAGGWRDLPSHGRDAPDAVAGRDLSCPRARDDRRCRVPRTGQ